jgi:hypothetical protein
VRRALFLHERVYAGGSSAITSLDDACIRGTSAEECETPIVPPAKVVPPLRCTGPKLFVGELEINLVHGPIDSLRREVDLPPTSRRKQRLVAIAAPNWRHRIRAATTHR